MIKKGAGSQKEEFSNQEAVMLFRYPNRKTLTKMDDNPGFQEVHKYREAGLERAVLLATDEMSVRELFFAKK